MRKAFAAVIFCLVASGAEVGEECKTANLLQRSKTKGSLQKAGFGPHPFVEAVHSACSADLAAIPSDEYNFYQTMSILEEHKDQVSGACKNVITATADGPNPKIFEVVDTIISPFMDEKGVQSDAKFSIGYIKAPLFFSSPEKSPLFKTWFLIQHAKVQPAPGGMLFVHLGGPSPGVKKGLQIIGAFSEMAYVHENFDLISVDQRGMGLSAVGLLNTADTFAFPNTLIGLLGFNPSLIKSVGSLVENFQDGNSINHQGPCSELAQEHASEWMDLRDPADMEEVETWLDAKAKFTALCSAQLDRDDGEGGTYNMLQYMGTQALAHDIEWLRWALGAPTISLLGFSYGTRVAAAYSSQFPARVRRVAVTGVMAPIPDLLDYARNAALNTGEILGFIQGQCVADPECMKNPFKQGESEEPGYYFKGDINEAINELFWRSAVDKGQWYKDHCNLAGPSVQQVAVELQTMLTSAEEGALKGYDQGTWPKGFLALPALVFQLLQMPCSLAKVSESSKSAFPEVLKVFDLIPALDMTGKWGKNQVAKLITDYGKDITFSPGLNMFMLYASAAYGWPQLPTPIGFSNPTIDAVIVNPLYDERTGMKNAQEFQLNFPKSSLVTSPVGGHCVDLNHGAEGWHVLEEFLLHGSKPSSGDMVGKFVKIDFAKGVDVTKQLLAEIGITGSPTAQQK